jgi:hypothetical protein
MKKESQSPIGNFAISLMSCVHYVESLAEFAGSNPTRSTFTILGDYGIILSLFLIVVAYAIYSDRLNVDVDVSPVTASDLSMRCRRLLSHHSHQQGLLGQR